MSSLFLSLILDDATYESETRISFSIDLIPFFQFGQLIEKFFLFTSVVILRTPQKILSIGIEDIETFAQQDHQFIHANTIFHRKQTDETAGMTILEDFACRFTLQEMQLLFLDERRQNSFRKRR